MQRTVWCWPWLWQCMSEPGCPSWVFLLQDTAHPGSTAMGRAVPHWWQVTMAWWLRLMLHVGTKMLFTQHQLFSDSNGRPSWCLLSISQVLPKKEKKTNKKSDSWKILNYSGMYSLLLVQKKKKSLLFLVGNTSGREHQAETYCFLTFPVLPTWLLVKVFVLFCQGGGLG